MTRTRTIVGIGESLRVEFPDRIEPGGTAALVALGARRFGHTGVPISRLGQDPPGDEIAEALAERGLDLSHLQRDPDHPTGRLKVQRIGRIIRRSLDPYAAFDELQWDFDLSDIAPVADAVVCGHLGGRSSQARTVIERFLDEATSSIRIAEMTDVNNLDDLRSQSKGILDRVDIAVTDEPAIRALVPQAPETALTQLCRDLARRHSLVSVVVLSQEADQVGMTVATGDSIANSNRPVHTPQRIHTLVTPLVAVALCHGLLSGWDDQTCINLAMQALQFTGEAEDHNIKLPDDMLRTPSANDGA